MSDVNWFCAHAVFYYRLRNSKQTVFLVHENVLLIHASDSESALARAEALAREHEDIREDGSLQVEGEAADYVFAGIRKVIEVELNPETAEGKLMSDIELTYSVFELDSQRALNDLALGKTTRLLYRE